MTLSPCKLKQLLLLFVEFRENIVCVNKTLRLVAVSHSKKNCYNLPNIHFGYFMVIFFLFFLFRSFTAHMRTFTVSKNSQYTQSTEIISSETFEIGARTIHNIERNHLYLMLDGR